MLQIKSEGILLTQIRIKVFTGQVFLMVREENLNFSVLGETSEVI